MKPKNLTEAILIVSENHSNEVVVNKSFGHASNTGSKENPTLHIKSCTAAALHRLVDAGFTLSMDDGLLSVQDYSKQ